MDLTQPVWFDRTGKQLDAGPEGEYRQIELSPDGTKVAFVRGSPLNIWILDMQRRITSRFTTGPLTDDAPLWSPDGANIAFRRGRPGAYSLFRRGFGVVGRDELLMKGEAPARAPLSWSRDGRYLAYVDTGTVGVQDIWGLPLSKGGQQAGEPVRVTETPFVEGNIVLSPDGRWVAYFALETGRPEIYIQSFPEPGARQQVSTSGGVGPRWRIDGKELYYIALDGTLMAISISAGPASIGAGTPEALFQTRIARIGTAQAGRQYDVAPNGSFLINVVREDQFASPITVILNWATGFGAPEKWS